MYTALSRSLSPALQKIFAGMLFTLSFAALVWAAHALLPFETREGQFALGVDWYASFHPATAGFLQGHSPYLSGKSVFDPPWLFVLTAPVVLLPIHTVEGAWVEESMQAMLCVA